MSHAKQLVLESYNTFWQGYAERDLDNRFSVCADDLSFFGTGLHERANSFREELLNKLSEFS